MPLFSDLNRKQLESNSHVEKVTNSHVVYTLKFVNRRSSPSGIVNKIVYIKFMD
jgi:hypothetical protein